jgi:hypothetical protein
VAIVELPRFAGMVRNRTLPEIADYARQIADSGYDPVAIGAVIENETAKTWSPAIAGIVAFNMAPGYAVGLIQFSPDTAKKLGTSTAALKKMSFSQQVAFLPKYYALFGPPSKFKRPVDYYLAGWGTGVGTSDDYVLARAGDVKFEANKALARGDDVITTGDLAAFVSGNINSGKASGTINVDTVQPLQFAALGLQFRPVPGMAASVAMSLVAASAWILWGLRA